MKAPLHFSSSQIMASVLGAAVLLGGAYAVGRSQGPADAVPAPVATAAAPPSKTEREPTARKAETPVLCSDCARVLAVHEESREGKASGLGAVGGAVIGGLLGNQIGGGTGKKIATVGGAVAGGMAGNEIEKRQKSHRVWMVRLRHADGRNQTVTQTQVPDLRVGDLVRVRDGRLERQAD